LKRAEGGVGPREDNRETKRGRKKRQPAKDYRGIEEKIREGDEPDGREQVREKVIDFIFIFFVHIHLVQIQNTIQIRSTQIQLKIQ